MREMAPRETESVRAQTTGTREIHRSFSRDVERPLKVLDYVTVETLCHLEYGAHEYPLYLVRCDSSHKDRPTVLISGGVHGDEPAGVYAAMDFLRDVAPHYRDDFGFVVLPCVNPSGFEAHTLETMSGENLNRLFGKNATQPVVRALERWLADERPRFRVTFDFHETPPHYRGEGFTESDNPRASYLFETMRNKSERIGRELIDSLPESIEVCQWPRIYLDDNVRGLISYPEACHNPVYAQGTTFDAYLNGRFTEHSFTTETPTGWGFDKRIETHLRWLKKALDLIA